MGAYLWKLEGVVAGFTIYVQIIQIIVSIALIAVILVQAKGQGGLGGIFGGEGAVFRTRRGVEKTLFNVTVGLAVAFFFVSIASVLVA
jgi:preprotein translocase subunit SecG